MKRMREETEKGKDRNEGNRNIRKGKDVRGHQKG